MSEIEGRAAFFGSGEERAGNLRDLNLVGAAVNLEDLRVTAELLDLVFGHIAVAAKELHGLERHIHRRLRRVELPGRSLGEAHLFTGASERDLPKDQVLKVHARHLHLRDLQLDELEIADGLTELHARLCIIKAEL